MADSEAIELVVGLGNPGPRYDQTRHNAGFWFADEVARRYRGVFRNETKFAGDVCRVNVDGRPVWLLKPQTYMNRSGHAVRLLSTFYKIPLDRVLVAHDEIDLPPGTARLKRGGGHGGHNGLRDIIGQLGRDFLRLRLGVGHPGHRDEVVGYVLARPSAEDEALIRGDIDDAVDVLPQVLAGDLGRAMNALHSRQG
jgi:PTH1 family peptidyl-tRNA hydrolase